MNMAGGIRIPLYSIIFDSYVRFLFLRSILHRKRINPTWINPINITGLKEFSSLTVRWNAQHLGTSQWQQSWQTPVFGERRGVRSNSLELPDDVQTKLGRPEPIKTIIPTCLQKNHRKFCQDCYTDIIAQEADFSRTNSNNFYLHQVLNANMSCGHVFTNECKYFVVCILLSGSLACGRPGTIDIMYVCTTI